MGNNEWVHASFVSSWRIYFRGLVFGRAQRAICAVSSDRLVLLLFKLASARICCKVAPHLTPWCSGHELTWNFILMLYLQVRRRRPEQFEIFPALLSLPSPPWNVWNSIHISLPSPPRVDQKYSLRSQDAVAALRNILESSSLGQKIAVSL